MKITIESTSEIVAMNGVPCRVWKGVTERGSECFAYVYRVGACEDIFQEEFEKELCYVETRLVNVETGDPGHTVPEKGNLNA